MLERVESEILTLRKVLPTDLDAIREYRAEFLARGDSMDGTSCLRRYESMADWYRWIRTVERGEAENWVKDTQFLTLRNSDGRLVGMLDVRHTMTQEMERFFGGIGYSVRPSERGKGYATAQLGLAKAVCRSLGMERVLVCCYRDNPASGKVILRNGGVLENEVRNPQDGTFTLRYWIAL